MIRLLCASIFLIQLCGCGVFSQSGSETVKEGPKMNESVQIEEKILADLKANLSLDPDDVSIKETSNAGLPDNLRRFYVEKKGSFGTQNLNYIAFGGAVYSSQKDGDFSRLLEAINFQKEKKVNADQFWQLYSTIGEKPQNQVVITESLLAKPYDVFVPILKKLHAPKLEYLPDGARFAAFTYDSDNEAVTQKIVTVSGSYAITVEANRVK